MCAEGGVDKAPLGFRRDFDNPSRESSEAIARDMYGHLLTDHALEGVEISLAHLGKYFLARGRTDNRQQFARSKVTSNQTARRIAQNSSCRGRDHIECADLFSQLPFAFA